MTDKKGNATWLFIEPSRDHHNSESFWTTFFALYILGSSRSGELSIPVFHYIEDSEYWKFEKADPLKIPANLDRQNIVVEGKIKSQIANIKLDFPINLQYISPDIIINTGKNIIIIETKTVGSKIEDYQKELYQNLAKYLQDKHFKPQLYFLISAGHEEINDFKILSHNDNNQRLFPFKLLLWEQIFKDLHEKFPDSFLDLCLGDIQKYYEPEKDYLRGRL